MDSKSFEKGLKTRREVLGAEYVDTSLKNADDFNMPMQELVTQYCWDEIWNRPGLDRRTRSIINLAMLTALQGGQHGQVDDAAGAAVQPRAVPYFVPAILGDQFLHRHIEVIGVFQ